LGVCLGAQLAAEALGAKVYPNPEREIGWFPVQRTPVTCPVLLDMPPSIMAFHWHGDTFDLPPGALHLAYSEACANQAFIWRNQVLGLQFHIELSASDVESVLDNVWNDPSRVSAYVQNDEHIREGLGYADLLQPLLEGILFRFAG
jgi:GMP synthase-like glutamine amidotransferase